MSRIYIATRLYNINDRLASLSLCNTINGWIDTGLLPDLEHCFLPYRDSNSQIPKDPPDFGQAIFDIDQANVRGSVAVVGYMDGPVYDSGMGFETGFAHALGIPAFLITTDYFKQSIHDSPGTYSISKLVEHIATRVIHVSQNTREFSDYEQACLDIRFQALEQLQQELIANLRQPMKPTLQKQEAQYDYYIDANFGYTEPARELLNKLTAALDKAGKKYIIGNSREDISADLQALTQCQETILYADAFDFDIDSTILQGIAYGLGIGSILYSSSDKRYVNGDFIYDKNPMIHYSAKAVATSLDELIALISK